MLFYVAFFRGSIYGNLSTYKQVLFLLSVFYRLLLLRLQMFSLKHCEHPKRTWVENKMYQKKTNALTNKRCASLESNHFYPFLLQQGLTILENHKNEIIQHKKKRKKVLRLSLFYQDISGKQEAIKIVSRYIWNWKGIFFKYQIGGTQKS